jgi:glycine betaine/proline transport system substrate-binding protein
MDGGSAKIGTAIPAFILEQGDGCTVEVNSTTTIPAITSMTETGSPDAITEVWMNNGGTALEAPLADVTVINAGPACRTAGSKAGGFPRPLPRRIPRSARSRMC